MDGPFSNNQWLGVRARLVWNYENDTRRWEFTLVDVPTPRTLASRFEDLALVIRRTMRVQGPFNLSDDSGFYAMDMIPADTQFAHQQRIFRRLDHLTGQFLQSLFESLVHSDETIEEIGLRVVVRRLYDNGGAGRASIMPKDLAKMGVSEHADIAKFRRTGGCVDVSCGILAVLMSRYFVF